MACSFSDFPVFVLHFGHPKPQALSANLEISMSNLVNLKDLFDDLNTAFQKIISGFVGSQSGTYTPPGTIEGVVRQADYTVNFPKAFSAIPSVVASGYVLYQNKNYPCTVSILSRTKSGFTCRVYCADGLSPRPTINWTASI